MHENEELFKFLEVNHFKLIKSDSSAYFGDYYNTFTNGVVDLRFSSSKSLRTVDIRNASLKSEWYDLALLKALLYNEEKLNKETTIEEYNSFLEKELHRINELFNEDNYLNTKKKLDDYGNKRVKQMFPGIK